MPLFVYSQYFDLTKTDEGFLAWFALKLKAFFIESIFYYESQDNRSFIGALGALDKTCTA